MRVVNVKDKAQCEACLARLCVEVFGREAGIVPLASFAGTLGILMRQEAAQVLALTDRDSRPVALALLVLDAEGRSMELAMLQGLPSDSVIQPGEALVSELAHKAPLRVNAGDADQQAMFTRCGIERWFDEPCGLRVGLGPRHPASGLDDLPQSLGFDQGAIIQSFKQDREVFEGYKQRFVTGLENFPERL
ncbi:hypothetical protein [Modicisalibacter zincidurans]|uniref:hypothetical protein n=1 Tax=Modicisalibacter zincidurans TaxID=1178777 RepID=UPI0004DB7EE4|nr:hypothetical protein [Halomonas zincidurans]